MLVVLLPKDRLRAGTWAQEMMMVRAGEMGKGKGQFSVVLAIGVPLDTCGAFG
jgi:hypothetical protein